MKFRHSLVILAASTLLIGCGEAGQAIGDMKDAAIEVGKGAAKAASEFVDTKTACTLAGQNEAFCGCLQTELGAKIDPKTIDALGAAIKSSLGVTSSASAAPAGQSAPAASPATATPPASAPAVGMDQKTKDALIKCGVQGAVGEAQQGG
jgi:hypothetical protein